MWPAWNSNAALTHPVAGLLVQRESCLPPPEGWGEISPNDSCIEPLNRLESDLANSPGRANRFSLSAFCGVSGAKCAEGRGEGERHMANQETIRAWCRPLGDSSGNLATNYKRRGNQKCHVCGIFDGSKNSVSRPQTNSSKFWSLQASISHNTPKNCVFCRSEESGPQPRKNQWQPLSAPAHFF